MHPRQAAPRRIRTRFAAIGVGVLGALVAAELALQVGSYVIWQSRGDSSGGGRVILCVGDSMTWGLGADYPEVGSYPRQLERRLAMAAGPPWRVLQGGWPGQTSREVLANLPGQLRQYRPELVYVLVGINDYWRKPALLPAHFDAGRASFPWICRTGRLFTLMCGWFADDPSRDPPFVGTWHHGDEELVFEPDGRLRTTGQEFQWLLRDGRLFILTPPNRELEVPYRCEGGRLWLNEQDQEFLAGASPTRSGIQEGWSAVRERRWDAAIDAFTGCLNQEASAVSAHEGIVIALWAGDRTEEAVEHVAWLERRAGAQPARATSESLAHARIVTGDVEGGLADAVAILGDHADSERAWKILAGVGRGPERQTLVLAALERALQRMPAGDPSRVALNRARAWVLCARDPVSSLRGHFDTVLAGGAESAAMEHLFRDREFYTEAVLESCLAAMALGRAGDLRMRRVYRDAMHGRRGFADVLEAHLLSIVRVCRRAGVQPVLLTYPFPRPAHDRLIERLAVQEQVGWIAMRPEFERRRGARAREELFLPDDHCTDAGYGIMAAIVAADVARRTR